MRIIAVRTLREFWQRSEFSDAEQPLRAWYAEARAANWSSPAEVKRHYAHASIVGDSRIVFNIAGNKYRLVVKFNYAYRIGYVRFIGTHAQYDSIDVTRV